MSVSSLPEWKQLLLERKKREEEERERREKEEEEKLASMPAWKRGIIQRRKAKQDNVGEREKDICLLQGDVRSPSDCLSDTDSSVTVNLGSELSLSPDPGQWLEEEPKLVSQVSVETIVPVHENPFIRTQSVWRKSRNSDGGNDLEVKEKEKPSPRGQDVDSVRGRDIEPKKFRDIVEKEKSRDRSQGRENSKEVCENDKRQQRESVKDGVKDQELFQLRKDAEEKETHSPSCLFSPRIPCLRTIRAENIIIIEQDRKGNDERRGKWRDSERERPQEDQLVKKGMKMDLREILAGGGSVTEIRASEVLIIKPSVSHDERSGERQEDGEMKTGVDLKKESVSRELKTDMSWLREKEKEKPWGQATVINKNDRKDSLDDSVFVERGGRVSQLLSKFGEHPKPPSRSKSSDNFHRPGGRKDSEDQDDQLPENRNSDGKTMVMKNTPKRSFSFSDRVVCAEENGLGREGSHRTSHSNRNFTAGTDASKFKVGCPKPLIKERFGKYRNTKNDEETEQAIQRRVETDLREKSKNEVKKTESADVRTSQKVSDTDVDNGFTVASVKITEGISFARRVPIRHDGRTRSEREIKQRTMETRETVDKNQDILSQSEEYLCDKLSVQIEDGAREVIDAPAEKISKSQPVESHNSVLTDSSNLLCTVRDKIRGPELQGTHLSHSVLSPQTENLISKIEKVGDMIYANEKSSRAQRGGHEVNEEKKPEMLTGSESSSRDAIPRSPKRTAPIVVPLGSLEIQIPRTVFYVAEDMMERKRGDGGSTDGQESEKSQAVERRDSWRIGKPLSRIESLREKIRQRELEKQRRKEAQDGDGSEAVEVVDPLIGDSHEESDGDVERKWEVMTHMQRRPNETGRRVEETTQQTPITWFDVTQEVHMSKTSPQLPVSFPHLNSDSTEEVISESTIVATEVNADSSQKCEGEDCLLKHVENLRQPWGLYWNREEAEEEEENELSEEEDTTYSSSVESLSPSPPHPNSLAAMSRIYNLDTAGSRSGLCLRERAADMSSPVHLVKVKPLISNLKHEDREASSGADGCGVQKVQRQIEQFQLKEQEVHKSSPIVSRKDKEIKVQQSPKNLPKHHKKDNEEKLLDTKQSQHGCPPASLIKQTITITPSFLRSQSPDESSKTAICGPTPASSPSSPSPCHSPSISPSPTPSPKLFSIRSASGGLVKRGATITITPKKLAVGGATESTVNTVTAGPTKSQSEPNSPSSTEPVKKKYPTAEEIEVIGGYQNLEKSCLVKNKETPKKQANVCFDEDQLEQVCEYPSETCMLTLGILDSGKMEGLQEKDSQEDEDDEEEQAVIFKSTRSLGIATRPRLRVDESCPR